MQFSPTLSKCYLITPKVQFLEKTEIFIDPKMHEKRGDGNLCAQVAALSLL
jgi:hypothetical protein